jgi:hypothetical protein
LQEFLRPSTQALRKEESRDDQSESISDPVLDQDFAQKGERQWQAGDSFYNLIFAEFESEENGMSSRSLLVEGIRSSAGMTDPVG